MGHKKVLFDTLKVIIGNLFKLISGLSIGLILPMYLSIEGFGYFRLFSLYLVYFGLFHFGFIDGIYIKYGGYNYSSIDKNDFRMYTRFFIIFQVIIAIIALFMAYYLFNGDRQFVFIILALNIVGINVFSYYQHLSQALSKFSELTLFNILFSLLSFIAVIVVIISKNYNYRFYLFLVSIINYTLAIFYILRYRGIFFGKVNLTKESITKIKTLFIVGIPMLAAYLISIIMLNFSKQIVDWFYDIETFAMYSFAFSMMNLANVFIYAISTILYPILKRTEEHLMKKIYTDTIQLVLIITMFSLALYFPLTIFIDKFLPKYHDSLKILRVVLPSIVLVSSIQIVKLNYFRALGHTKNFLMSSLYSLAFTITSAAVAYIIFNEIIVIALSYVLSTLIWFYFTDYHFIKLYKVKVVRNYLFLIIGFGIFYILSGFSNHIFGMFIYTILITIAVYLMYQNRLKDLYNLVKKR